MLAGSTFAVATGRMDVGAPLGNRNTTTAQQSCQQDFPAAWCAEQVKPPRMLVVSANTRCVCPSVCSHRTLRIVPESRVVSAHEHGDGLGSRACGLLCALLGPGSAERIEAGVDCFGENLHRRGGPAAAGPPVLRHSPETPRVDRCQPCRSPSSAWRTLAVRANLVKTTVISFQMHGGRP